MPKKSPIYKDAKRLKEYKKAWYISHKNDKKLKENHKKQARAWHEKNPFRSIFKNAQRRAKKLGWEFDLTMEWVKERYTGFCELSGLPFEIGVVHPTSFSPSLDRKDSRKGYTQDNCRFILFGINCLRGKAIDDTNIYKIAKALVSTKTVLIKDNT